MDIGLATSTDPPGSFGHLRQAFPCAKCRFGHWGARAVDDGPTGELVGGLERLESTLKFVGGIELSLDRVGHEDVWRPGSVAIDGGQGVAIATVLEGTDRDLSGVFVKCNGPLGVDVDEVAIVLESDLQ